MMKKLIQKYNNKQEGLNSIILPPQPTTYNLQRTSRGFTLVESLIAISILLIVVVGPIGLISDSLGQIYYARNQAIAINLAQEGIEVVRQKRDSNMISGAVWIDEISNGVYIIDAGNVGSGNSPIIACGTCSEPQPIYIDVTKEMYRQALSPSPGTFLETPFSRLITMGPGCTTTPASSQCKVTARVDWRKSDGKGSISVSSFLFKTF